MSNMPTDAEIISVMRDGDPWGQSLTSADEAIDATRKQGGV